MDIKAEVRKQLDSSESKKQTIIQLSKDIHRKTKGNWFTFDEFRKKFGNKGQSEELLKKADYLTLLCIQELGFLVKKLVLVDSKKGAIEKYKIVLTKDVKDSEIKALIEYYKKEIERLEKEL